MTWPAHLRPGALRFARTSVRYDETIAFYRDVVGLPIIGGFRDSFGEDGTIFGLPDASVQLEIVRAHEGVAIADIDMLILYLDNADAVVTATAPLRERGLPALPDQHPYWEANGGVSYHDPDGRQVVFAPWVYGRDPEPSEHTTGDVVHIEVHDGPREELRPSFRLAEDSETELASYFDKGRVLVARRGGEVIGHLQLVDTDRADVMEIKSMAVREDQQGRGIGAQLVDAAAARASGDAAKLVVSTAAESTGNLRFYQRQGFRLRSIERDAFGPANGYADGIEIDGIPMRDRVWLDRDL